MFANPTKTTITRRFVSGGSIETEYGVSGGEEHITYNTGDQIWTRDGKVMEIKTSLGDSYYRLNGKWFYVESIQSMMKKAKEEMGNKIHPNQEPIKKNIVETKGFTNKTINALRYVGSILVVAILVVGLIILWAFSMGSGLNNDDEGYQKSLEQARDKKSLEVGQKAFKKLNDKYGNDK